MIILLYALNRCLIRNGLAPLQDDQWHQWILAKWQQSLARPCGRGCGAQQAGEARCEARLCGSRRTALGCARESEKNDDRDAVISLYVGTVVTRALASVLSSASRLYGMHWSVCRASHGDLT